MQRTAFASPSLPSLASLLDPVCHAPLDHSPNDRTSSSQVPSNEIQVPQDYLEGGRDAVGDHKTVRRLLLAELIGKGPSLGQKLADAGVDVGRSATGLAGTAEVEGAQGGAAGGRVVVGGDAEAVDCVDGAVSPPFCQLYNQGNGFGWVFFSYLKLAARMAKMVSFIFAVEG